MLQQKTMKTGLVVALGFLLSASVGAQEIPPAEVASVGPLKISSWELREVLLDPPHRELQEDGTARLRSWGYQLTVRAETFPVRALDPQVHLDEHVLVHYEWCNDESTSCIVYTFWDPEILRSERRFTVIYAGDERTRTVLPKPFDPERLVRLPDDVRRTEGIPELEGGRLEMLGPDRWTGSLRLKAPATARLAWRVGDGWRIDASPLARDEVGRFEVPAPSFDGPVQAVALLRLPAGAAVPARLTGAWPKGWEVLDRKSVPARDR